jgi:hypothetical protein
MSVRTKLRAGSGRVYSVYLYPETDIVTNTRQRYSANQIENTVEVLVAESH